MQYTPDQLLLLKAALLPPDEALPHWQAYRNKRGVHQFIATDQSLLPRIFDPVDGEAQRLMPMIYRNLEHTGDALIPHLRGIYRYTWIKNQRHLLKMQQVVDCLNGAGIDTIMLKGIPLSIRYYRDMGVRVMGDLDVMVPTRQADPARTLIQQPPLNLRVSRFETNHRNQLHAMHSWDADGIDVDLHWNLLTQHVYATADEPFWRDRQPLALPNGIVAYTLSPTHQLFHVLVHGCPLWHHVPVLRWIPDSLAIARHPDAHIDWEALTTLAQQYRMTLPVQQGLQVLNQNFSLSLPDTVHRWLRETRPSEAEQTYYRVLSSQPTNLIGKVYRYLRKNQLAYALFHRGRSGPSFGRWLYGQMQMSYGWFNHDLPFDK